VNIAIKIAFLYVSTESAKLSELGSYIQKAKKLASEGNKVKSTSADPVWFYLKLFRKLHSIVTKLFYYSHIFKNVIIFCL